MKKIFILIIVLILAQGVFAKPKKSPAPMPQESGYVGELPDVTYRFQKSIPTKSAPLFNSVDGFNDQNKLKPIPRDNTSFINIIIKKDKTSGYTNDINYIIPILEKLASLIESEANNQQFAAQAYFLKINVDNFREKYLNKPESSYISFKKLMQLNMQIQTISLLRSESQKYDQYLTTSGSGYIYNQNNIDKQLEYLIKEINQTVIVLKEAN